MHSIGILGVGELTEKVVRGLRHGGHTGAIFLSPRNRQRALALRDQFDCQVMPDNQTLVERSRVVILGVRPDVVAQLAGEVSLGADKILISLVAGMDSSALAQRFPGATVVRAMLSYAAEINATTVVTYPDNGTARKLLAPLGTFIALQDESAFEVATVAACMNGWFYFWLQDLQRWFVDQGLPHAQARQLVLSNLQDCLASARHNPDTDLETMGNAIATPGTFTRQGLDVLRERQVSAPWTAAFDSVLLELKREG
ncbi:NAD(P)-binding domain-containing protein [Pseudomonas sp.]|uniref:NAD(P)-binding domain-containing protein n=1 Tax=Pseudomonas sp. TaxID=306 RepID=UPI0028B00FF8|nr:NAD(P)-binding domain-containing protein [Pseudomonas sp.]